MEFSKTEHFDIASEVFRTSNEEFMRILLKETGVLEPDGWVRCTICKKVIGKCYGMDMYVRWIGCPHPEVKGGN